MDPSLLCSFNPVKTAVDRVELVDPQGNRRKWLARPGISDQAREARGEIPGVNPTQRKNGAQILLAWSMWPKPNTVRAAALRRLPCHSGRRGQQSGGPEHRVHYGIVALE